MVTAIIVVSGFFHIILAMFIFLKKKKSLMHILFSLLVLAELGWVIANYSTLRDFEAISVLMSVKLVFFFVVLQNTLFYLFSIAFPDKSLASFRPKHYLYILLSIVLGALVLSPVIFMGAEINNGVTTTDVSPAMMLFVLHAAVSIISGFWVFRKKLKTNDPVLKKQVKLLIAASTINWVIVPITNFVLTQALKTTIFIEISPIYTFIFLLVIAYTIVAGKLFNIRIVLARYVGYALVLIILSLVYSVLVFGLINGLFPGSENESLRQWMSTLSITPILFLFQATRDWFIGFSQKLFFIDSYDPEALIDELNQSLVSSTSLDELMDSSLAVIDSGLKPEKVSFYLNKTALTKAHQYSLPASLPKASVNGLQSSFLQLSSGIYDKDMPAKYHAQKELHRFLNKNDIELFAQLRADATRDVGYIMLGPKKNGTSYSKQDLGIIRIIANELVIAVENMQRVEEIGRFNETLQTEIEAATRKLQRSNEKLKALDVAKDEFISMASHQLRTPLTSVKGYISMVMEGDVGDVNEQQKKLLDQAFISSQRMVYLIADLLNVSRLRTGKFVIDRHETYLPDVIEGEISQLYETASARGLKIKYKKPKKFPRLSLDETKIRQVVMNFTDNAIYYTPKGGTITVDLHATRTSVYFSVTDTGIGVPKTEVKNLFTKFYRAGNAKRARPDGTGLGLFMAKKVVVAQGGAMVFKTREGKGSTFGFTFPRAKCEVKQPKK